MEENRTQQTCTNIGHKGKPPPPNNRNAELENMDTRYKRQKQRTNIGTKLFENTLPYLKLTN